jgi:hypothetical protein
MPNLLSPSRTVNPSQARVTAGPKLTLIAVEAATNDHQLCSPKALTTCLSNVLIPNHVLHVKYRQESPIQRHGLPRKPSIFRREVRDARPQQSSRGGTHPFQRLIKNQAWLRCGCVAVGVVRGRQAK